MPDPVRDTLDRPLRDLRISVTDRCNFRCSYCMPREVYGREFAFLPREDLLTFGEIERLARIAVSLGVTKVRITGGEPLLRKDVHRLVGRLAGIEGIDDLALTTNGALLPRMAPRLRDAGLSRITVSLDSLDDLAFRAMNDVDFPVARVLEGIAAAKDAGLDPIKVNTVVRRGVNDGDVMAMAERFRGTGIAIRFIEYMDVGETNEWRRDEVVPAAEIRDRIAARWPLEPIAPARPGEVATRWRYVDGAGEIGTIASVTEPFCGGCTRARLSSDGKIFTCLFGTRGHDVRALLRNGRDDAGIADALRGIWENREDRYSELRAAGAERMRESGLKKIEMPRIGG
ncbi:MAG: GTP 3',8-cyclase MoaA [Planctomycetota bacterium]